MADLGEGPGSPLFWVKKEEMTEEGKASRASKTKPGRSLTQGLDPPLNFPAGQSIYGLV